MGRVKVKEEIYDKCVELLENDKNSIRYIDELVAYLPICRTTFYDYFKVNSNKLNTIKELIDNNKVKVKSDLRRKWETSDNATLQMGAYKLLANEDELDRLSGREKANNILEIPKMEINVFKEEAK